MKKIFKKPFKSSLTQNILLILGILVLGYIIIIVFLRVITRHGQEFEVPDLYGMTLAEAAKATESLDLRLEVTDSVYIRGMERGAVSRQNPEAGSKVKKNRRILLVINSVIPRQSTMPSITGFSLRQARTELASNGLNVGKLIYVEDMATNNVLAQQYNGEDIAPGTTFYVLNDPDAFAFYQILGSELNLTVSDTLPAADQLPAHFATLGHQLDDPAHLSQIITSPKSDNSDRIYLYTLTQPSEGETE